MTIQDFTKASKIKEELSVLNKEVYNNIKKVLRTRSNNLIVQDDPKDDAEKFIAGKKEELYSKISDAYEEYKKALEEEFEKL